jgi:hypothetical protein
MQHHERGCPILAFFARVGHDAAQGGRRVEQAFQSCVQSHTRLVPSGRTGLQGAKRRLHTQGLGGWPIHAAPRERVPHPRVLCEGGTRCRLRRRGGWSRPSRPAFKATLGLCLPGELACKERSDAAGQFVGERAGSARAVGAGRSEATPAPTAKAPPTSPLHRDFTGEQNKSGRPKAARCFLSRSPKPDSRSPP